MSLDIQIMKTSIENYTDKNVLYEGKELLYWRNAYQIRNWFINNIDITKSTQPEITKSKLLILKRDIEKALINEEYAKKVFPATEYDLFNRQDKELYYRQLKNTAYNIEKIIQGTDFNKETVYYEEWL